MLHANMRPPMPGAQPIQYNQLKGPMPSMDNSHAHQLSNGDQNTSRSVALETTQAEKVVKFYLFLIDLEFNYAYTVNLSMRHFSDRLVSIGVKRLKIRRKLWILEKRWPSTGIKCKIS